MAVSCGGTQARNLTEDTFRQRQTNRQCEELSKMTGLRNGGY